MTRTLLFLQHKSVSWIAQAQKRTDAPPDILQGILAYAHKQSWICHQLAQKFSSHWLTLFGENQTKPPSAWPKAYRVIRVSTTQVVRRRKRQQAFLRLQDKGEDAEEEEMEIDT